MGFSGSGFRVLGSGFWACPPSFWRAQSVLGNGAEEKQLVAPQWNTGYFRLLNEFEIIFSADDRKPGSGIASAPVSRYLDRGIFPLYLVAR